MKVRELSATWSMEGGEEFHEGETTEDDQQELHFHKWFVPCHAHLVVLVGVYMMVYIQCVSQNPSGFCNANNECIDVFN